MPLISNVQIFSPSMDDQHLTAQAGVIQRNGHILIRIPLGDANPVNGGPIVGQQYLVRYQDEEGTRQDLEGFRYLGIHNLQLEFSTAPYEAPKRDWSLFQQPPKPEPAPAKQWHL